MTGRYEDIGAAIGRLVDKKQKAYGRSFDLVGGILETLYPHGIKPEQYRDLGGMIRILDKFFRIATSKKAFGEDPWEDVAGYALLMNRELLDKDELKPGPKWDRAALFGPKDQETAKDTAAFMAPFSANPSS